MAATDSKLVINEDWIRRKLNLINQNIDNVKSVALPGTYQEKILDVGDSLRNFTRLTTLDLSRNAIEILQGFDSLKMLERLNLYYNNVQSLDELSRLKANTQLQDLDLRLNPIARDEADYRLFLIHMLPSLRKLDDRVIRDQQRKAALMHFSVEELEQFTKPIVPLDQPIASRTIYPRAAHIATLARSPFDVADDDDALLSEALSKSNPASRAAHAEFYPPQVIKQLNKATGNPIRMAAVHMHEFRPFSASVQSHHSKKDLTVGYTSDSVKSARTDYASDGTVAPTDRYSMEHDEKSFSEQYPNLFPLVSPVNRDNQSEISAVVYRGDLLSRKSSTEYQSGLHSSHNTVGIFTPNPQAPVDMLSMKDGRPQSTSLKSRPAAAVEMFNVDESRLQQQQHEDRVTVFLTSVSELADRYWNGSKSLIKCDQFKRGISELLKAWNVDRTASKPNVQSENEWEATDKLREELSHLQQENIVLQDRLLAAGNIKPLRSESGPECNPSDEARIRTAYIRAQRDLEILKNQVRQQAEVNEKQAEKIAEFEIISKPQSNATALSSYQLSQDDVELSKLREEKNKLNDEVALLRQKLKQAIQIQEMAAVMQESQRSLVLTNEHLLRELSETKMRQDRETQTLKDKCAELKQTITKLSASSQNYRINGTIDD